MCEPEDVPGGPSHPDVICHLDLNGEELENFCISLSGFLVRPFGYPDCLAFIPLCSYKNPSLMSQLSEFVDRNSSQEQNSML